MADVLHVACAVEGDYVPHAAAMLHSVLEHTAGAQVAVHYMHGGDTSPGDERLLAEMVRARGGEIEFIVVPDERVAGLPTEGFTGKATWYRIFLPELLPEVETVLYLDADLIATDDLRPLWRTDLGDAYLGAVTNVFAPWDVQRAVEIGLSGPDVYFNAGVLLMNLAAMRAGDSSRELLDFAVANAPNLGWRDQDTLNLVLGDRRLALHPRWNCMNATHAFREADDVFGAAVAEEARRHPAIRHFEGPGQNKPWHYLADPAARELYMRHRAATPWPRFEAEGRTPRNVLRRATRGLRR